MGTKCPYDPTLVPNFEKKWRLAADVAYYFLVSPKQSSYHFFKFNDASQEVSCRGRRLDLLFLA